jgi:hypothetical protein
MYGYCFTGTFHFIDSLLIQNVSAHVAIIGFIFVNFDTVDSVLGKHGHQSRAIDSTLATTVQIHANCKIVPACSSLRKPGQCVEEW